MIAFVVSSCWKQILTVSTHDNLVSLSSIYCLLNLTCYRYIYNSLFVNKFPSSSYDSWQSLPSLQTADMTQDFMTIIPESQSITNNQLSCYQTTHPLLITETQIANSTKTRQTVPYQKFIIITCFLVHSHWWDGVRTSASEQGSK